MTRSDNGRKFFSIFPSRKIEWKMYFFRPKLIFLFFSSSVKFTYHLNLPDFLRHFLIIFNESADESRLSRDMTSTLSCKLEEKIIEAKK